MKKIFNSLIIIISIIFIFYMCLYNPSIINTTIKSSINLFLNNIFPSLFISLILSSLLIDLSIPEFLGNIFGKIFYKLFKAKKEGSFVFFMSILTGCPTNAKYINDLINKNIINNKEALKLLIISSFTNPFFIINTVGFLFLNNIKYGYIIVISLLLTNITLGLLFKNIYISNKDKNINIISSVKKLNNNINNTNILDSLFKSFISSVKILVNIFYIITLSLLIINILNLNSNTIINAAFSGLIEITTGLKNIKNLNIASDIKLLLSTIIISFGGFSIHLQIFNILNKKEVNYFYFLLSKIISIPISIFYLYILKFILL